MNDILSKIFKYLFGSGGLLFFIIAGLSYRSIAQTFTLPDNTLTVDQNGVITGCSYDFKFKDIIIPDRVNGQVILGIAPEVFKRKGITSLKLPLYLEGIGNEAFFDQHLDVPPSSTIVYGPLILPPNLKYIGFGAFQNNLFSGELTIPASVTEIGALAFNGGGFRGSLTILSTSLKVIRANAFSRGLYSERRNYFTGTLNIPNSVTQIEAAAFYESDFSGELRLPPKIEYIGAGAFARIYGLSGKVRIPSTLKYIGWGAFAGEMNRYNFENFQQSQITDFIFEEPSELEDVCIAAFRNTLADVVILPTIGIGGTRISWLRKRWLQSFEFTTDIPDEVDTLKDGVIHPFTIRSRDPDFFNQRYRYVGIRIDQVKLAFEKYPSEGGDAFAVTSPNDRLNTYDIDSKVTLGTSPKEGYRFAKWVIDGREIFDNNARIIMDGDKTAKAYFTKQVRLTIKNFPAGRGKVVLAPAPNSVSKAYDIDTNVRLTFFSEDDGWGLDSWIMQSGNDLTQSTDNTLLVLMDEDKEVSLTFKEQLYLTLEIEGGGNVKDFQVGKNAVDKAKPSFELKGIANPGYIFDRWEITFSGQPSTTERLNPSNITSTGENLVVKAIFKTSSFLVKPTTILVSKFGRGTLSLPIGRIQQERNSTVNLSATPEEGYRFDKWMLGKEVVTKNPYSFQIDKDTSVTAYFIEQKTLTLLQEPSIGAILLPSMNLGNAYDFGSEVTLGVGNIPSGYSFDRWTIGDKSYSEPATTIKLNANTIAVAYFLEKYSLTVLVHNNEGGRVTPATPVTIDQKDSWHGIEIVATPDEGYRFEKWVIGGRTNTKNPYKIKLQGNTTATAYFVKQAKLEFSTVGSGSVSGAVSGKHYNINKIIELVATPEPGYRFEKWLFEGSNEGFSYSPLTIELASDTAVVAYFIKQVKLNLLSVGHGTINGGENGHLYDINSSLELTAEASEGYQFDKWVLSGVAGNNEESKGYPLKIRMTKDTAVTAYFVVKTIEKVTLTLETIGSGKILGASDGSKYDPNSVVILSVVPATGYEFEKWGVIDTGSESEVVSTSVYLPTILTGNVTVKAYFVRKKKSTAKLNLSIEGYGTISGADNGTEFGINSKIKLYANPNNGYRLEKWGLSGKVGVGLESREQPLQLTITKDTTVTAYFVELEKVELTLSEVGSGSIWGPLSGSLYYKGDVSLIAIPNAGYQLNKWELDGQSLATTDTKLTINLTKDTKVTAYFSSIDGILSASPIKLYPMPVRNILTVEVAEIVAIRLLSFVGVVVQELYGINANQIELDISNLPASTYFLEITQKNFRMTVRKVIKE